MSCPNSDPNFDNILKNFTDINAPTYPDYRRNIYYGLCIWIRLFLYTMIYVYRREKWMPYLVGIFSIFSILNLKSSLETPGSQWWSKRFDLFISVILLFTCAGVIQEKIDPVYMSVLLYLSLFGGITQSLFVKFC